MSLVKEFKEFALKGNMVDMAIGIVIGGAFGTVIKSLVDHILMPPIGYLTGKVDFSTLSAKLPVPDGEPVEIKFGLFINAIISLLIIAAALFMVVKMMNTMRSKFEKEAEAPVPTTKSCNECLMEIPIAAKRCGHCTSPVI
jgi:large conductance mechanosensitive channel